MFFGLNLNAQIDFIDHVIIDDSYDIRFPNDAYAADLDGDGDMDVLSTSSWDDKVVWFENLDGQGKFGPLQIITTETNYASSVRAADLDGDGDMDVLSSSGHDAKIAWYENLDGQGNFGAQLIITENASFALSVYASDLDGDGDMDVLSASRDDNKIAWYENTSGEGDFGAQQIITTNAEDAYRVYSADLDGDGDMDVLSASAGDNKVAWYENLNGLGNFGGQEIITTDLMGPNSVLAVDVDGDNDMDVVSSSFDDKFVWFENLNGQASFGVMQVIDSGMDRPYAIAAADVDLDNDMDLLLGITHDNTIAWYENTDGLGDFGSANVIGSNIDRPSSVHFSDINGDGHLDVLSVARSDDEVIWFQNLDGLGTFGQVNFVVSKTLAPQAVVAADLDDDGDMDILTASEEDDKIAWLENKDGNGTEWVQQVITRTVDFAKEVFAADIDNDGDVDVLGASRVGGKIAWYENMDGLGDFGTQHLITTTAYSLRSVFGEDIDGDGDLDVIFCSGSLPGKIGWFENTDGLGNYGSLRLVSELVDYPRSVYAVDVNGDGSNDILSASSVDNKIAWYENIDGLGNFGQQIIISTDSSRPYAVSGADLDGDGDMDVISGSYGYPGEKILMWYENIDGQGTFEPHEIMTDSGGQVRSIYTEDINGDGDLDIVIAINSKITYFENLDGLGNFAEEQYVSWAGDATSVYASDINGDGRMDIVSAASYFNEIAWYENTDVLGIEQSTSSKFTVYPVPTTGEVYIKSQSGIALIEVYDQLGQLVLSIENQNSVDLSSLTSGLYYMKILDEFNDWESKKVIKK